MRIVVLLIAFSMALEGNAIVLRVREPRRPVHAAASREKGRHAEMRTFLVILLLAGPAAAGGGSWQVVEQGGHLEDPMGPGNTTGNAKLMNVSAAALRTRVDVQAMTDCTDKDESGSGTATETTWLTLKFVGSKDTTDHRWRIESRIYGDGTGAAYANLDCDTWAESIQIEQIRGDVTNRGIGEIAVDDSGGAEFSLGIPDGFIVTLPKKQRTKGSDTFLVDNPEGSSGAGEACRVRVDDYAHASVSACSTLGAGHAMAWGILRTNLVMQGFCRMKDGTPVYDEIRVTSSYTTHNDPTNVTKDPSGGRVHEKGIPPNKPTKAERAGKDDHKKAIPASSLPNGVTHAAEPTPSDGGHRPTGDDDGDGATPSGTTTVHRHPAKEGASREDEPKKPVPAEAPRRKPVPTR